MRSEILPRVAVLSLFVGCCIAALACGAGELAASGPGDMALVESVHRPHSMGGWTFTVGEGWRDPDVPARYLIAWRERYPDHSAGYLWAVQCDPPDPDCGVPAATRLRASYAVSLGGVRAFVEGLDPDDLVAVYDLETAVRVSVEAHVEQVERVETHTEEVVTWSVGD